MADAAQSLEKVMAVFKPEDIINWTAIFVIVLIVCSVWLLFINADLLGSLWSRFFAEERREFNETMREAILYIGQASALTASEPQHEVFNVAANLLLQKARNGEIAMQGRRPKSFNPRRICRLSLRFVFISINDPAVEPDSLKYRGDRTVAYQGVLVSKWQVRSVFPRRDRDHAGLSYLAGALQGKEVG